VMGALLAGKSKSINVSYLWGHVDITHSDIDNPSRMATPGSLLGSPDMLALAGENGKALQH